SLRARSCLTFGLNFQLLGTQHCSRLGARCSVYTDLARRIILTAAMSLSFKSLHPSFVAEVSTVDLRTVSDRNTLEQIRAGMDQYAILVLRDQTFAGMEQVEF